MAITNKAAIQALIDAYTANITLYITSNNNKEITGAQLKQILDESSVILEDLKDSYFNLLDEPRTALSVSFTALNALDWDVLPTEVKAALDELADRVKTIENEPNQTAFETPYQPTSVNSDWLPEGDPTEVRGGLDILAGRTGVNLSQDIAYVTNSGNNTGITPELGNPLKPYDNFGDAINATPVGGTVKALGGAFTEGLVFVNKNGITLDISGCQLNGRLFYQASNVTIIAYGAIITNPGVNPLLGSSSGTHTNFKLFGGTFQGVNGSAISLSNSCKDGTITDATFTSNIEVASFAPDSAEFINCIFTTVSVSKDNIVISTASIAELIKPFCKFVNCEISGGRDGLAVVNGKAKLTAGTRIINNARYGITNQSNVANNYTLEVIAESCYIFGATRAINLSHTCDNVRFSECTISSDDDCVYFSETERTTANNNNIFERCSLYAGTGAIFSGTFDVADNGNAIVTNCIYNKAYAGGIPEVVENGTTTIVGIQNVEF